jgi:hypothetical protein
VKLILILSLAGFAFGQPAEPKLQASQQETRLAKLEALVLREQIAVQQVEKIRSDQAVLYAETCKAAGIDPDPKICMIDLNAHTVTKRPDPVPNPSATPKK